MNIDALRSLVHRDHRSSLWWATLCLAASAFSVYAYRNLESGPLSAGMAGVFGIGGIALVLKARWTLRDFEDLAARGEECEVWIEVVDAGGGDSASDTHFVRVFSQARSLEPSIVFQTALMLAARDLKLRERRIASLLRRDENRGMVAILVEGTLLIPNGSVRYLENRAAPR